MPERLEISVEERSSEAGPVAVVRVAGEIDLANVDQLADALRGDAVRRASGAVLDLSEVPFMDSSGLRVLLTAIKEGRPAIVAVLEPGSPVARLIELAELAGRVPAYAAEQEALAALPASGSDNHG